MIPGLIMGFREGLEAFLLTAIILKYISTIDQSHLKSKVIYGGMAGILLSLGLGVLLSIISTSLGSIETLARVWESGAGLLALALVTAFILWMIRHGRNMAEHVEGEVDRNLSPKGLFLISLMIVAREGTEIAIFTFAGKYRYSFVALGVLGSLILTVLIFCSLVRVNIALLFRITLAYLILQAGYLLGYTLHEGLSALKAYGAVSEESILFARAFDVSRTVFSHKDGVLGIPLNILVGWYSKPEWVQLVIQYLYTVVMFLFWFSYSRRKNSG